MLAGMCQSRVKNRRVGWKQIGWLLGNQVIHVFLFTCGILPIAPKFSLHSVSIFLFVHLSFIL